MPDGYTITAIATDCKSFVNGPKADFAGWGLRQLRRRKMHHIERGTGPKLLLIHGLGGSWQSWSTILDALSAHRTVIAVDLPGHGASPIEGDSGTFVGLVGTALRSSPSFISLRRPIR